MLSKMCLNSMGDNLLGDRGRQIGRQRRHGDKFGDRETNSETGETNFTPMGDSGDKFGYRGDK